MFLFILNSINVTEALFESLVWVCHTLLVLFPYWITKYFIEKKNELISDKFWANLFQFIKSLSISSVAFLFLFFGGSDSEYSDESRINIDGNLALSLFMIIFVATLVGFFTGYKNVAKNIENENVKANDKLLLSQKQAEIDKMKLLEEFRKLSNDWIEDEEDS